MGQVVTSSTSWTRTVAPATGPAASRTVPSIQVAVLDGVATDAAAVGAGEVVGPVALAPGVVVDGDGGPGAHPASDATARTAAAATPVRRGGD